MNKTEYLLSCLIEESSEVIKATTKSLRFGLNGTYCGSATNAQDIEKEYHELVAIIEMLEAHGIITLSNRNIQIREKKEKLLLYMEHSKNLGTLIE